MVAAGRQTEDKKQLAKEEIFPYADLEISENG